jgi:chromatin remodeling complex protein RSC6
MVRTSKTTTAPAPTPTPAAKKAPAKKATKAAAPVAAPTPAPVVAAPEPIANEVVEEVSPVSKKLNEFGAKLQQIGSIFSSMKGDFKTLEKLVTRELKAAQKSNAKRAKRAGNRQPSGFVKPTRISDELAKFLGKSVGTEMARTEVSKEINEYIRTHKLQNKDNGRIIEADAKLSTLLKLQKDDELSYFNLQRYMKSHFIKAEPVVATA